MAKTMLTRRTLLGSAAALAAVSSIKATAAAPRRQPNFVFIMADDLGAFDLSCYGRPDYTTPHIDSLAREGMKFRLGYASSSSCAPSRTALISGRYPNRLMVGSGIGGGYPSTTIGYPPELPSLPSVLKRAGYRTALVGKWDLGELPTFGPLKSGYDEFLGYSGGAMDYWTHDGEDFFKPGTRIPEFFDGEKLAKVDGYATDIFSDRACDFIRRTKASPFLLSLHYSAPHWPWQTRTDRGQPRFSDLHFDGGTPAIYAEMVKAMDEGVGRVLKAIDQAGLSDDTVVVFTSDNGGERFSKMWPLRGEKGLLWEGGTRVPLLVRWPGHVPAGSESDQVALSMDFLPTFAALAGTSVPADYAPDGVDLSPQLLGSAPVGRTVFWKTPDDMLSALEYPWKYLRQNSREYFYNLEEDETEHANYKLREPKRFAAMKAKALAWSETMLAPMPFAPASVLQDLEALDPPKRR